MLCCGGRSGVNTVRVVVVRAAKVTVVRGRRLPIMDRDLLGGEKTGSADPFVTLSCGAPGVKAQSKVVKKDLDPIFLERFTLPLAKVRNTTCVAPRSHLSSTKRSQLSSRCRSRRCVI